MAASSNSKLVGILCWLMNSSKLSLVNSDSNTAFFSSNYLNNTSYPNLAPDWAAKAASVTWANITLSKS